jgi:glycerol uptake facilitator-like aquaporin
VITHFFFGWGDFSRGPVPFFSYPNVNKTNPSFPEKKMPVLNYLLEAIASFLLTATVILSSANSFAIGAMVVILHVLTKPISGGFFNPMLVLAGYATGSFPQAEIIPYIASQCLGGLIAVMVLNNVLF